MSNTKPLVHKGTVMESVDGNILTVLSILKKDVLCSMNGRQVKVGHKFIERAVCQVQPS